MAGGPPTMIDAGSFESRAKAHVAPHGGKWVVIERMNAAQAQQRRAWLTYFAWLDDQTSPRGKKFAAFSRLERLTVPTSWPIEFDASAPAAPPRRASEEEPSSERRHELAEMLRAAVRGASPEHDARRARAADARDAAVAHHGARLEELQAEYATSPPVVATPEMDDYLARMRGEA
jgi:hypothetical protein